MSRYIANGNMYGCSNTFSNPYRGMKTIPFKTSVNELYNYMLRRCLNRYKEYKNADASIEFAVLRHMQEQIDAANPLFVILSDNVYYFNDSKGIRSIDKYESS